MSEPMTDDDLAAIEGMLSAGAIEVRYGREYDPSIVRALVAEVRRLRDGIRTKAEAWDRDAPDALAFRVTADFRTLIGDDSE